MDERGWKKTDGSCSAYLGSFVLVCLNALCSVIQLLIIDHQKKADQKVDYAFEDNSGLSQHGYQRFGHDSYLY